MGPTLFVAHCSLWLDQTGFRGGLLAGAPRNTHFVPGIRHGRGKLRVQPGTPQTGINSY